ncbi:MAG TPA: CBS domain-containing protein [Usitatibacter sp.]|jgi:CBS domain-containing protein|nr:CBS domain-containing protein [Usitatibacter sp.]
MKTGDLCKRQPVTATPEATLCQVAVLMRANHVGSVVIVDAAGKPVGIITDRDIVVEVVAAQLDPRSVKVGEVMSRHPTLALATDDASWSLKVMRDRGVRRLPVMDEGGALVGLVALDDLLESAASGLVDVVQAIGTERLIEGQRRRVPA